MTLILTAPARIAIMAFDASPLIRGSSAKFVKSLDTVKRPFVQVELTSGDYPPAAQNVEEPLEEFTLQVIADKFGQGAKDEAEDQLRQVVNDVLFYFYARTQLQFSNVRHAQSKPLGPLAHVLWARLYGRQFIGPVAREQVGEGEGPYWGATLNVRVQSQFVVEEVLVSDTDPEG